VKDLTGKVAFITGSAGGIGLGIARALTEFGVKVALADIDEDALEKSAAELAEAGGEVTAVRLDVTDRAAWVAVGEHVRAGAGAGEQRRGQHARHAVRRGRA
jgi:NADP-dependent 3-hydroxy acid dehydrogenase YdfG